VSKIIFWIVVVFVVLFVLRLVNMAKARHAPGTDDRKTNDQKPTGTMLGCSECGVSLPKADAPPSALRFRCSGPACAQRHGNAR